MADKESLRAQGLWDEALDRPLGQRNADDMGMPPSPKRTTKPMTNDREVDLWHPEIEKRTGELLMTFSCAVTALKRIDDRLFATLENGQTIDLTELLGEPRH